MSPKSETAAGWPMLKGEYKIGDPKSCVAVVTCGSHLEDAVLIHAGAAISGSCKTENLGIEKLVSHIISNPNIRFLIVTGAEVKGHITGEAILMLHKNGVSKHRIVGAKGAIPYIENLSQDAVERFRVQVECIDMINNEDMDAVSQKIKECLASDPGAYPAAPFLQKEKSVKANDIEPEVSDSFDPAIAGVSSSELSSFLMITRLKSIDQKIAGIGDYYKFQAGIQVGMIEGFVAGLVFILVFLRLLGFIF
jgi:tetrahydromethanopterin S-methyltransferase subunit A